MEGVDSPGLRTIEDRREYYCKVDLQLGLKEENSASYWTDP